MSGSGTLTPARRALGYMIPALALLCAQAAEGWAAEATSVCTPIVGRIVSVQGSVELQRAGQQIWDTVARLDTPLCQGDLIHTGPSSRAALVILPEKFVRLDQNSTLSVSVRDDETIVEFFQDAPKDSCGAGYFITRFPRKFKVRTQFINAAVEGTEFLVSMSCSAAAVAVFEGKVSVEPVLASAEPLMLKTGETVSAGPGEQPAVKLLVKPVDAVQWALYYPPLGAPGAGIGPDAECGTTAADEKSSCLTARAEQRLRVGRVDEAQSDIEASLALVPDNSDANALLAVISVVKNDKPKAIAFAQRATRQNATSPQAWIALSYAQQASFELDAALASAERAAELAPGNSTAQSRVAELLMSLGRISSAERAAQAAVRANPDESRARTILGFVHLAQIDTKKARTDFEAAIQRDSSDPLPRLGLGLAIIRDGDLKAGREQIEIAVALDPTNSLIRSYVGKAYYEENTKARDKLAGIQFGLAKQLDPKDPTPWFYDAVRQDADNRPVEALSELQRSIDLNDSRAVTRSRLLLDEDRAARSAGLARIYGELGFSQLALAEGFRALGDDPINYSANRFLADAYLNQPSKEVGRLSELLQSQLRQPENVQPLQPQLSETGLFIVPGAGPAQPSYNEYNRLFVRNGLSFYADGIAGANGTYGDDAVVSVLAGRVSLSVGQFHYQTDGFRPNADQKRDLLSAFGQFAISAETSVQFEARTLHSDIGDLQMRFDPDNFFPNDRDKIDTDTYRVGLRHDLSADTQLIVSALTQRSHEDKDQFRSLDTSFQILPPPFFPPTPATVNNQFAGSLDQRGYVAEAQVAHRWTQAQLIVGAGWFESHNETTTVTTSTIQLAPPFGILRPPPQTTAQDFDAHQGNAYVYSYFQWPANFRWTLGLSVNDYSSQSVEGTPVNPKFGVMWTPFAGTTVRAAAFRTFRRDLISDQTIEPTEIAGFNQFFDDPAATDARRFGLGLDQRFTRNFFGGFEVTHRLLKEPLPSPLVGFAEAHEDVDRAYLYWMPARWAALRSEYYLQKLQQPPSLVSGGFNYLDLRTERAPLGVSLFGPAGFSFAATASWIRQKGTFVDTVQNNQQTQGTSTFWVTDLELRWRLPRRAGTIAVGVDNLFGRRFSYFEPDPANPTVYPERFWYARFQLSL